MKTIISSLLLAVSAALFSTSVFAEDVVAIGTTGYVSLEAAFTAAQDGDTIKVLKNFKSGDDSSSDKTLISVTKNCTLDLNNLTVELPKSASKKSYKIFQMDAAKTLTIKSGSFIGPQVTSGTAYNPILAYCNHAEGKIILNDVKATFGIGSKSGENFAGIVCAKGAIEIKGCTLDCSGNRNGAPLVGVYNLGNSQVTIEDSTLDYSKSGVNSAYEIKSVPVYVPRTKDTPNQFKLVLKGDCKLIPASTGHYAYTPPAIETMIGGTMTSSPNGPLDIANTLVTVEAGRYNFNPQPNSFTGWIAEGCTVSGPVDNIWTVAGAAPVATDVAMDQNGNKYTSLATAFANVTDEAEITLLDDCEVTSPILVSENVSLNLDGHTISYTLLGVHGDGTCFNVTGTGDFTIYSGTGTGKFVGEKHGMVTFASSGNLSVSDVEMLVGTGWTSTFTPGDPYDPAFRIKSGTAVIADTSVTESFLAPVCIDGAATVKLGAGNNFKVSGMTGNASTVNPVLSAVVYCKDGTVSVTGGRYESDCYGVYLTGGTIGTAFTMSDGELHAGFVVLQNDLTDIGKMKVTGGKLKVKDTDCYLLKCGTATPKIVLEGGLYNVNPNDNSFIGTGVVSGTKTSSFVASGYKVETVTEEETTWYKVVQGPPSVAQDDAGNQYESLAAAFSDTAAGGTITLLKDCEVTTSISRTKNVTLDMNNHQIDVSGTEYLFKVSGGDFYLSGPGTINAWKSVFEFTSSGTLTIDDIEMNSNIGQSTSASAGYGNKVTGGTVIVTKLTGVAKFASMFNFAGACTATFGDGNSITQVGKIAELPKNPYPSSAFALSNGAQVTVTGGYYKSDWYGAYIMTSGGTFTMTGGTLEAGKMVLCNDSNNNGLMSISGGQFKLVDTTCWLATIGHGNETTSIAGGEFNVNPIDNCFAFSGGINPGGGSPAKTDTFVAEGYGATPVTRFETETWYKVGIPPVAVDDDGNEYATLKAALEDVKAGGTIKVLAGCSLPSEAVKINRSFTLDLNGQTIAVPSYQGSILSFLAADMAATVVISNGNVAAGGSTADTCFIECNNSNGKVVLADLTATVACNKASPSWSPYPAFVRSSADGGVVEVVRCNFAATSTHKSPLLLAESGDLVVEDTTLDNSLATGGNNLSGAAIGIRGSGGSCVTLKGDCRFSRANGTTGTVVFDNGYGATDDILAELGTYNFDPSAWVDTAKYQVTGPEKNIWTVEEKPASEPVARIGGTDYETLGDAVTAAKAGDTIVLLKDVEIAKTITPAVSCTIDLGGKTVSAASTLKDSMFSVSDSQLAVTIKNGSVSMPYGDAFDTSLGFLSVSGANVTLDGVTGTVHAGYYLWSGAICVVSAAKLTIRNSSLTETAASAGPVLYAQGESLVDVIDSVLDASKQNNSYGADYGSAAYIRGSTLTVSGNSSVLKGHGNKAIATTGAKSIVITGGTFSQDPSSWVDKANYEVVNNGDGTWTVKSNKPSDPLPDPKDVTTPEKVAEVMADAADSLKANVKTVEEYTEFRQWVVGNGIDQQAAKESPNSFFSFATAQAGIVDTSAKVTAETVKTVGIEPTADGVKLTVKIDDLPVGEAAQQKYLEKVFGAEGSDSLTGFAKENVQYVAESMERTADGSVTFTVKPAEKFDAPSQFFFVGAVYPDGE